MSLHIITGCMFSGKTTALMTAYDECDTSKVLINHATDVRYSAEADVTTHDRRTRAARPCHRLRDVTAKEEEESKAIQNSTEASKWELKG